MKLDTLLRVAQILRNQPAYSMPVTKLHACLTAEVGGDAGTYAQMLYALKQRPESFMVLEAPALIEDDSYSRLLDQAGLGACARVVLAESPDPVDAVGLAAVTLAELWARRGDDPAIRDYVAEATRRLAELTAATPV